MNLDLQSDSFDQYLDLTNNINLTNLIFNTPVFNNSNMALDLRANDKLELVCVSIATVVEIIICTGVYLILSK